MKKRKHGVLESSFTCGLTNNKHRCLLHSFVPSVPLTLSVDMLVSVSPLCFYVSTLFIFVLREREGGKSKHGFTAALSMFDRCCDDNGLMLTNTTTTVMADGDDRRDWHYQQ